ncbi:MAG: zinc-binding dehydrogenase, partial [Lentisphaeria bacterium]|nr:zinc-binding dehydrogenase [Lentisphaeria bacterium]
HLDGCGLKYMVLPVSAGAGAVPVLEQLLAYNVERVVMIASPLIRKKEDVEAILTKHTIDVALDCAGGELLGKCLNAMNPGGRWILVSTLGGENTTIPLRVLLKKHLHLMGSTLRSRSDAEKSDILAELAGTVLPEMISGKIHPVIHEVLPMQEAAKAHALLASQKNIGKVVLTLD